MRQDSETMYGYYQTQGPDELPVLWRCDICGCALIREKL